VTTTLDDNTVASYPGNVRLSHAKLKRLQPELYGLSTWIGWEWHEGKLWRRTSLLLTRIEEHLLFGDSRAAVVISTSPLLIAAYSDELDCVALLRFNQSFVSEYNLQPGSRLVTVNLYDYLDDSYEDDLIPGPDASGIYGNFTPLIADFLTSDLERLAERKAEVDEDEWRRTKELGESYLAENHARPRDGRPFWCCVPADQVNVPDDEPAKPPPISFLEVPKRIFFVSFFLLLTVAGATLISRNPRLGWFTFALFGTMLVLSIVSIFQLPRDLKTRVSIREALSLKAAHIWLGTFAVSFGLGLAGELILDRLNGFWPNFAIWLCTFASTAAFYPFLRGDMKKDYPTFTPWAIFCALWGIASVIIAHFADWLERG
jgi:hypothetical protein